MKILILVGVNNLDRIEDVPCVETAFTSALPVDALVEDGEVIEYPADGEKLIQPPVLSCSRRVIMRFIPGVDWFPGLCELQT